jgi:cysteine desulfurase
VDEACRALEERGAVVTRVPVRTDGRVDAQEFVAALRADTVLVSLMHAQNETGVLQPVEEVARVARERGIVVHCDAAQSVGKIPVKVARLEVDALTVAGHKLYAPKGVGALFLRRGTPFVPYLRGAGHERGRRSGTESVPLAVGLGAACALAEREIESRASKLRSLRDRLEERLRARFPDLVVHGAGAPRLPNTASVALPGIASSALLARLDGVAAASGAACHAGGTSASKTLLAMGLAPELALATLRLTVGRPTRPADVDAAADRIAAAAYA